MKQLAIGFSKIKPQNAQESDTDTAHGVALETQVSSAACRSLQTPKKSISNIYKRSNQCYNLFFLSDRVYSVVLNVWEEILLNRHK